MFKFRCNKEHMLCEPAESETYGFRFGCVRELGTRPIPPGRQ